MLVRSTKRISTSRTSPSYVLLTVYVYGGVPFVGCSWISVHYASYYAGYNQAPILPSNSRKPT